ncbi:MAG: hypothetical protein ACR2HO_05470 [Rubrobacteraceae bacterium]
MSLKQRELATHYPETAPGLGSDVDGEASTRKAGIVLLVVGMLLLALTSGDALAGASSGAMLGDPGA